MKIRKIKAKMTMGHVVLKDGDRIPEYACSARNHVHKEQDWFSMCLSPIPEGHSNPGWYYCPLFQNVDANDKVINLCHPCSQLLMKSIPKGDHICPFKKEKQRSANAGRGRRRGRGQVRGNEDADFSGDDSDVDSDDEPTSLEQACMSKSLAPVQFHQKLLQIGNFVATNFGEHEPDWAIGYISQVVHNAKFTHEVTYGDGVPGDDDIRQDQRLKLDDKYFDGKNPKWGNWTFLEPVGVESPHTEPDLSDSSGDE